ncbi:MAG TPA: tetratricopeptide repeat protein, partial [Pirellulales bacterium]|nr:tetratricopeptide repeat protein [Pirellulales bacterium]
FGEWYPLSMLSHMLDCQLYGLHPAGHHLTNVLLHAATAVTLFLALWRMTGALWPSALVAALFALHPLRVESVAWVAERRDVLSGLLFMLTLGAYGEYVRHPRSLARYLGVVGLFGLALMAKAIVVTLPALLLLLDFWPLERIGQMRPDRVGRNAQPTIFPWRIVVEKVPLLALSIAAAIVTRQTHATFPNPLTLSERLSGAAVSCVAYLGQLFVPVGLSPFYVHPEQGWPAWQVAGAAALLLALTASAVIWRRSYPFFFVGWFWYVGMLVPVLGLTYLGAISRADRYTYLPQIGIDMALVWGAMRLGASWPARRWVFGIGSATILACLMASTWRQTGYWQDDKTLWQHALACDPNSALAHLKLGAALTATDEDGAIEQYRQALEIGSSEPKVYAHVRARADFGLGMIADQKGKMTDAITHYERALEWEPNFSAAHLNLAGILMKQGKFDEAIKHYQRSIELAPGSPMAYRNLALALAQQGKMEEAIDNFRQALKIDPNFTIAHMNLAALLAQRDDVDEAILHLRRAIEIDPDVASSYYQIAQLLRRQGRASEAAGYDQRGVKASRRYAQAQNLRGAELAHQGKTAEAIAQFKIAVAVFPDYAQAHCNLGEALASQGSVDEAISHYRRALEIDPNLAAAKQGLKQLSNR